MKTIQLSERELYIIFSMLTPPYPVSDTHTDEFNELRNKVFYALRDAHNDEPVSDTYKLPGGWIPVSERMPDETQPVIVASEGCVVQRTIYQFCEGVWIDWYEQYDEVAPDVFTHWMPLPAAPQQE
ncbi:DUF551 domain-containing protein [Citrobacter koseri]|uniref:DUF551 domain-containing protein n=1 Tax=Citrobacter koseri TaxID=545 RepID=UPI00254B479F|nr:DUF551 domain-containing protein [Citrobacter koseri]MEC5643573.1 DUF551 domain-containing protein [Citrobacter koseri]WOI93120.1 DUF551 domain-containing protein [Citrobacter koseri]